MSLSFTGTNSVRYPAPDVARGFMLALIALANVPFWTDLFPEALESRTADQIWILIRGLLIDHRAYPLFSLLFGFGLMTMIIRRHDAHIRARVGELDARAPGLGEEARGSWLAGIEREAEDAGRSLVRRRGWWMLLFGAVHALFFLGDIIGTYALVAVLLAGLLVKRRWKILWAIAIGQQALMLLALLGSERMTIPGSEHTLDPGMDAILGWAYPLFSLLAWIPSTILTPLLSQVIPAVIIGARLATSDIVSAPQRHARLLGICALGGLSAGALLGAPEALAASGLAEPSIPAPATLHELGGLVGAIGWLALLIALAGPPRARLGSMRNLLAAVGKRSMSAYLGQTLLFIAIFGILGLAGVRGVSPLAGAGIALGVWTLLALACGALEAGGSARGPAEVLLRRAVAASAAPTLLPPVPVVPAMPSEMVEASGGVGGTGPADPDPQG